MSPDLSCGVSSPEIEPMVISAPAGQGWGKSIGESRPHRSAKRFALLAVRGIRTVPLAQAGPLVEAGPAASAGSLAVVALSSSTLTPGVTECMKGDGIR